MKKYEKPLSELVFLATSMTQMLEVSMIHTGGTGRFDAPRQTWDVDDYCVSNEDNED